ncbi:Mannan endo-1,6-alpha-mannosidase [Venturia inaequalis]|nr:Mannan endo-1,6-alpha-mannosidase [Venturia inaequalis]
MGTARVSVPVKFGLLDLPPELRVKIYRSLFIVDKFIFDMRDDLQLRNLRRRDGTRRRVLNPNNADSQLLRTCKLVLHEGLPILWGENIFAFTSVNALNHSMCGWPLGNKGLIRSVVLEHRYSPQLVGMNRALPHFISLGNLRKFSIDVRGQQEGALLSSNMHLKTDVFLGLEKTIARITRCKGFLEKLFRHSPAIECGVIDGRFKREEGEVRYKFVPNGKVQSRQTFSLAFDPSWPAENYEHLVGKFEG